MATRTFFGCEVEINAPQERFKAGEMMKVEMMYDAEEKRFVINVPEVKKVEADNKPKPEDVFTSKLVKVKATITAKGNAKIGFDRDPDILLGFGRSIVKSELDEAFKKLWERITKSA